MSSTTPLASQAHRSTACGVPQGAPSTPANTHRRRSRSSAGARRACGPPRSRTPRRDGDTRDDGACRPRQPATTGLVAAVSAALGSPRAARALDAFVMHRPAFPTQEPRDPSIPIPPIRRREFDHGADQPWFVIRQARQMPVGLRPRAIRAARPHLAPATTCQRTLIDPDWPWPSRHLPSVLSFPRRTHGTMHDGRPADLPAVFRAS